MKFGGSISIFVPPGKFFLCGRGSRSSSTTYASHINFKTMNVCIVFNSKYSKPETSVSQTMSQDAQRAAKRLRI